MINYNGKVRNVDLTWFVLKIDIWLCRQMYVRKRWNASGIMLYHWNCEVYMTKILLSLNDFSESQECLHIYACISGEVLIHFHNGLI